MRTLSTLRTTLRNKANQTLTTGDISWGNSEVDTYIREGIRAVIDRGRAELVGEAYKQATLTPSSGHITKPGDYHKFIMAMVEGKVVEELLSYEMSKVIENNDVLKSDTDNYRLYDYSGTDILIQPTVTSSVYLHYISTLNDSDMENDSDTSPLTDIGDDYAVEYAYGLVLQSKMFQPEVGERILLKVLKMIG